MGKRGTGKPKDSPDDEFIAVGRVLAPWGVSGMLKIEVLTDFAERFAPGQRLLLKGQPFVVEGSQSHRGYLLVKLKDIEGPEAAAEFSNCYLELPQCEAFPLPPGQYYRFQIIGLQVWATSGEYLGKVEDVLPTGSNDVYVVHGERGETLIPAIEDVIKEVDLKKGRLTIEPIAGLLEPSPDEELRPKSTKPAIKES